jgi:uncharacterized protein YcfJ
MRQSLIALAFLIGPGFALAAAPALAEHQKERVLVCDGNVKKQTTKGTVIGAVAGGVLGNVVAGNGAKTEGAVLGAGVGAVAGHEIAKKRAKKRDCHYVYR